MTDQGKGINETGNRLLLHIYIYKYSDDTWTGCKGAIHLMKSTYKIIKDNLYPPLLLRGGIKNLQFGTCDERNFTVRFNKNIFLILRINLSWLLCYKIYKYLKKNYVLFKSTLNLYV